MFAARNRACAQREHVFSVIPVFIQITNGKMYASKTII